MVPQTYMNVHANAMEFTRKQEIIQGKRVKAKRVGDEKEIKADYLIQDQGKH